MSTKFCNPSLLAGLQRRFGVRNVAVINAGNPGRERLEDIPTRDWNEMQQRTARRAKLGRKLGLSLDKFTLPDKRPKRVQIDDPGEEFKVDCPHCSDQRKRLYINHRWGRKDAAGRLNLWQLQCWNEQCFAS